MKWLKDNYITLIVIVVIITIILQLKRIFNLFSGGFTSWFKSDFVPADDSKSLIDDILAKSYAETLYQALRYLDDNEDAIYNVFENIKSIDDFNKVSNAFGQRMKWFAWRDLIYWLNADLNDEEKRFINDNYVNIF